MYFKDLYGIHRELFCWFRYITNILRQKHGELKSAKVWRP